ncbi:MAG TPA: hypothetical protein VGV90_11215 [Solirubrobacteraceae bacterium]|nr:hypothetical protein [Solirubrobacteraceae bacterium]
MYSRQLLALLALFAAVAVLAGCGAEDLSTASIAKAAEVTVAERGMRIAMDQTLTLPQAGRVSTTGSGVMDTAGQTSHLTMKVTSVPDVIVGAFDKSDLTTEVITDRAIVYTHSAQLSQLLGAGRKWLRIDAAKVGEAVGIDVSMLTQPGQDPSQAVRQLAAVSGKVKTVGREDVRGVDTMHYRAVIDLRRYPALAPAADRAAARDAIERLIEATATSTIPVDVWIGEDDLVRRVTQKLSLKGAGGPSTIEQRFELYDFGTKVDIKIPPPSQVTAMTELAASGAATIGP